MKRLPYVALVLIAVLLVAADKKADQTTPSSAAQIQRWVKQLGDEDFRVREEATRDLIKAEGFALEAVTKATQSEDFEVKQRASRIKQIGKHFEKVAIDYLENLGGEVTVDEKSPGKPVIELSLSDTKVTDAGLVHLKWLIKLQTLYLNGTKVTDLSPLMGLTNLKNLHLDGTQVTNLSPLKGLTNLEQLLLNPAPSPSLCPLLSYNFS